MSEDGNSRDKRASSPATDGRPSVAPVPTTRVPYEVYSQPLEDRAHGVRELAALVDGTPNFTPHYYAVCKSGLAIAVNIGGLNAAQDIPFLAHAANCHHGLLEALKHYAEHYCEGWCKESGGTFDDCGGCIARAAIAKASAPIGSETSENKPGV